MRRPFVRAPWQSTGERRKFLAHLATGCFGAAFALIVVIRLDPGAFSERPLDWYERWVVLSGFVGGVSGLWLSCHRLGRAGLRDPLIGLVWMTGLGAVIGGTLALPLYGTMFGPFTLAVIFAASPVLAGLWLANAVMVHLLLRSWHAERDTIFGAPPPLTARQAVQRLVRRGRPPLTP